MGIDIYFTDASLKRSKYALCKPDRAKYIGFHADIPEQGVDEFASYRRQHQVINMTRLEQEEPSLYEQLARGEPILFRRGIMFWNDTVASKFGLSNADARRLRGYIESRPSTLVLLDKMPDELADEAVEEAGEQFITAWDDMAYEKRMAVCKPCPIRPLEETDCSIRFSSYPGMNAFRQGFALAVWYAVGIDEKKLESAYFSFPHLDRQKNELPKHKIAELEEMCRDTPIRRDPELMFNSVVDLIEQMKPHDLESDARKVDASSMPFIDQFISAYIYRNEPYRPEDARKLIPYLETLLEIADWAVWDADDSPIRKNIIASRARFNKLTTALRTADKYGLEAHISY